MEQISVGIFKCTFEFNNLNGTITTYTKGNHIVDSIHESLNSELILPDELNKVDNISLINKN